MINQTKTKKHYSVFINQCAECDDLSQINVSNWDTIEESDKVKEAIKAKFLLSANQWYDDDYKSIRDNSKYKGDDYNGKIEIRFRNFDVFCNVEFHKCCKCGGNY